MRPRVDVRAVVGHGVPDTVRLMQSEINVRFSVNRNDEEAVAIALGPNLVTDMTGRARQMHFGNYYTVWNFGVDRPKLKVGQFVVPFGTLAEFDTHPLVLQTPYARTLGVRIDRGIAVEGYRGATDYVISVTGGDGRGRSNGSYAVNVHAAREYDRGNDIYRVGGSLLYGKQMPVFPTMPMPLPMGMGGPPARADKLRLAGDLDWLHGVDNIRAEVVLGSDDGRFVNGQWVSWNHPFSYETDLTVQADRWQQRDGVAYGLGVSLHHRLDDLSGVRLAYEPRWARSDGMPDHSVGIVTFQWYRDILLD